MVKAVTNDEDKIVAALRSKLTSLYRVRGHFVPRTTKATINKHAIECAARIRGISNVLAIEGDCAREKHPDFTDRERLDFAMRKTGLSLSMRV